MSMLCNSFYKTRFNYKKIHVTQLHGKILKNKNNIDTRSKKTLKVDSTICLRFCSNSLDLSSDKLTFRPFLQDSSAASMSTAADI